MRPGAWPRAPRDHPRVWGNCNAFCDYSNITLNLREREQKRVFPNHHRQGQCRLCACEFSNILVRVFSFLLKLLKTVKSWKLKWWVAVAEGLGAVVVKCTAPGKSTLFISTFPTSPLSLSPELRPHSAFLPISTFLWSRHKTELGPSLRETVRL